MNPSSDGDELSRISRRMRFVALALLCALSICDDQAIAEQPLTYQTKFYGVQLEETQPEFASFWVDSLGKGRIAPNGLVALPQKSEAYERKERAGGHVYQDPKTKTSTQFNFENKVISICSVSNGDESSQQFVLKFGFRNNHPIHATLLGKFNRSGRVQLPAVLHIPGQGTLRITGTSKRKTDLTLDYESTKEDVLIGFPGASNENPQVEYSLEVIDASPKPQEIPDEVRFEGYRRCWLNALQLSSKHRMLANHAGSDVCGLCYHEYSEIAMLTGALAENVSGPQLLRDSLDQLLAGKKTYAMPGYEVGNYPVESLDTWPSILIAAHNYYQVSHDDAWVRANINTLLKWGHTSLATDSNGNGLIEYHQSGNLNECKVRPANWWDCINFGHEDAYSNALAYRAFVGLAKLARVAEKSNEAAIFDNAAAKLKKAYYPTFYNPKTGMLAGWKSRDGSLHDYAFTFVQGIAITYGLIEDQPKANQLMDATFKKMHEVGFNRFDLGLPGNLENVPVADYYDRGDARWGGANAFGVYENGGASANHVYYTIAALYKLGRREEADRILFPILKSFNDRNFQGTGNNAEKTKDWKAWDGTPWGYEGYLSDNYLVVKAVLVRQGLVDPLWGNWKD